MKIDKTKIKKKLQTLLSREPSSDEIINGAKDFNIVNEILFDEVEELKIKVAKLSTKNVL